MTLCHYLGTCLCKPYLRILQCHLIFEVSPEQNVDTEVIKQKVYRYASNPRCQVTGRHEGYKQIFCRLKTFCPMFPMTFYIKVNTWWKLRIYVIITPQAENQDSPLSPFIIYSSSTFKVIFSFKL